jgi:hypothetical protein
LTEADIQREKRALNGGMNQFGHSLWLHLHIWQNGSLNSFCTVGTAIVLAKRLVDYMEN